MKGINDAKEELEKKIEITRELLHKKIEENIDPKEILSVSQELDKLIADYLIE